MQKRKYLALWVNFKTKLIARRKCYNTWIGLLTRKSGTIHLVKWRRRRQIFSNLYNKYLHLFGCETKMREETMYVFRKIIKIMSLLGLKLSKSLFKWLAVISDRTPGALMASWHPLAWNAEVWRRRRDYWTRTVPYVEKPTIHQKSSSLKCVLTNHFFRRVNPFSSSLW